MTSKRLTIVSPDGRITIPADVRKKLGLKPGDRVFLHVEEDTLIIKRIKSLFELKGFCGKALPLEEEQRLMEEAVARHVLGLDE